ncbi:MAG: hypothetical protein GF350_08585, partial [Chitinivibrionales bacterium]|nr:hypothetical protein [Chitinivibrionales bacterium]
MFCNYAQLPILRSVFLTVLTAGFFLHSYAVSYSGYVTDKSGSGVQGATVSLCNTDLSATTDASGFFDLSGTATRQGMNPAAAPLHSSAPKLHITDNALIIQTHHAGKSTVYLYNLKGALVIRAQSGNSSVRIPTTSLSGAFLLSISSGRATFTTQSPLIAVGGRITNRNVRFSLSGNEANGSAGDDNRSLGKKQAISALSRAGIEPLVYYLIAEKNGYFQGATAIVGPQSSTISITMIDENTFADSMPFKNPSLPVEERIDDLLGRLTDDEKMDFLNGAHPAIDRLGLSKFPIESEWVHGKAHGVATTFPHSIAMAATWDTEMMRRVAEAISDEGRAFANKDNWREQEDIAITPFSPLGDLARDPRWGRTQETYGECPYLASRFMVAFVEEIQRVCGGYNKAAAMPKHFLSAGPEASRHGGDAIIGIRDLWQTYMPAYKAAFVEAGAYNSMCAFSKLNGEHACASSFLLTEVLRNQWGMRGFVISDCGPNTFSYEAGCDAICNGYSLPVAPPTPAQLDQSVRRVLRG